MARRCLGGIATSIQYATAAAGLLEIEAMDYAKWMAPRGSWWRCAQLSSGWHMATDGRVVLYSPPDHKPVGEFRLFTDRMRQPAEDSLNCGKFVGECSVGRLREFVGEPPKETTARCDECFGSGTSICPHCEQDMDCDKCDGSGNVTSRDRDEPEPALMFGQCIDRVLIAEFLPEVSVESRVQCFTGNCGSAETLLFVGDGWKLLVAGMHKGEGAAEYEVFSIESESVT